MTQDAQVKLLVQVQDALRESRQLLKLFGAFVAPPVGSKLAVTLQQVKDAETSVQAAMIASLKKVAFVAAPPG